MDKTTHDALIALLPRLRRFAYGLSGSVDEGDDLVQAACERALTRMHQFEPGTRLDSWMFRIVQTLWIDRRRSQQRRGVSVPIEDIGDLPGTDGVRDVEAKHELAQVRRAVGGLPDEQREVLILVTVDGMSYREAAATLDIPIGTVMSRLARARLALGRAVGGVAGAAGAA
ncbi:MAG: RNA polymerase sigma factor [Alphaproteobacteria bacterium]